MKYRMHFYMGDVRSITKSPGQLEK